MFTSEELENIYHTMKIDATWQAFLGNMSKNLKENYVIDVPDDLSSSIEQTSYEMWFISFFFSFCFEQGETPPRDASIASHSEKTNSTTSTFFSSSVTAEAAPRESVGEPTIVGSISIKLQTASKVTTTIKCNQLRIGLNQSRRAVAAIPLR